MTKLIVVVAILVCMFHVTGHTEETPEIYLFETREGKSIEGVLITTNRNTYPAIKLEENSKFKVVRRPADKSLHYPADPATIQIRNAFSWYQENMVVCSDCGFFYPRTYCLKSDKNYFCKHCTLSR